MSDTAATDLQLLARYAHDRAEEAFAEIVRRHLNLVYSAALRQVRSPQLAEEVAQSTFADLAQNARHLAQDGKAASAGSLTSWLYTVTRRTAVDVVRREARRQLREQIATEMNALNATADDWTCIEPLLDDAMCALDDTDRTAVLLRYFENKSLREVGAALGASDDAAQKRVSRAVERLREFFAKRGVAVGTSGLVAIISANAVQAAPVGLLLNVSTTAALAGTTFASTATATVTQTIAMTTLQKALVTATVAVFAGAGIYEAHQATQLRAQVRALQQHQAPLNEQIQQLQSERDQASSQLALLREENERLSRNTRDLPRLRGEVGRLRSQTNDLKTLQSENRQLRVAAAGQDPLGTLPPEQLVRAVGWGTNSCQQIAARYSEAWLPQIADANLLLKLGLALYDTGKYQDALRVFQQAEETRPDFALVWEGHMLDLLGKRDEALVCYRKAAGHKQRVQHDQYGIVLSTEYVQQRIETPFQRIENQMGD